MDFDYSAEQRSLREEARRFLSAAAPVSTARAVLDDPARAFDEALWRRIAEQGWLGAAIAETHGGLGLGPVELGAIAEEIGASLAPVPFGSTLYFLAEALRLAGSPEQQAAWLPRIAEGKVIGCAALFEGSRGFDPRRLATRYADGKLTGGKLPVVDGGIADVAVVAAHGEGGIAIYLVELDGPGIELEPLEAVDGSVNVAEIRFDGAAATPLSHGGSDALDRLLATAAVFYAFEQIGGADRCLRAAIAYVSDRQAFGGPVARFQAVKHKLADIFAGNEMARSHAYHGAWAIGQDSDTLFAAAAAARIAASEAYWTAAREALHLHGAIGFTWEQDSHLFYRRAHHLSLSLGAPQWWKDRLFRYLNRR